MNKYIEAVRLLAKGSQPQIDISEMLYKHGCLYLLLKSEYENQYKTALKTESVLNKISVNQRYKICSDLFSKFDEYKIPYAVIKGAVLSETAYRDPFCRQSGDIDLLINRKDIDNVKKLMLEEGFVQGRVTEKGIEPFTRKELLFQSAMSHQTAPFIKKTDNKFCPYVNVDVNLDILWGESDRRSDMDYVLKNTLSTAMFNVPIKKLTPEMELISLCLHHYKDMNSLYLLYNRGLSLSLFCDIYFYIKNAEIDPKALLCHCQSLDVREYVYYCLYYTRLIFEDCNSEKYMQLLYLPRAESLINTFGLTDDERQAWDIDFFTRLFETNLQDYFEKTLSKEALEKIQINRELM